MEFRRTVRRVNALIKRATGSLALIAPLATRIVIGLAFVEAGTGKLRNFENVIGFFDSLGIPLPAFNAGLAATMETIDGIMLILGSFTRFFASGLTITMFVALLTADTADCVAAWSGASGLVPTDVTAFTLLLFLLWLVAYGAGNLSVDALLRTIVRSQADAVASIGPSSA